MKYDERRLGRQLALQCLFSIDYTQDNWRSAFAVLCEMDPVSLCLSSIDEGEEAVFYSEPEGKVRLKAAQGYAQTLLAGIDEHVQDLDKRIVGALENWNPDRVGRIEWSVLRIALYEMFYLTDVPATVAINEAINLAKSFGSEESPRFINGVLDRLRKHGDESPEPV